MIIYILISIIIAVFFFFLGYKLAETLLLSKISEIINEERKKAIKKSKEIIKGQINEQLAPYFPEFPYNPSEAKFVGKPIDFIIFKGLDKGKIEEIIFLEVKTNKSKLNKHEKTLKEVIKNKKIYWDEFRINTN